MSPKLIKIVELKDIYSLIFNDGGIKKYMVLADRIFKEEN